MEPQTPHTPTASITPPAPLSTKGPQGSSSTSTYISNPFVLAVSTIKQDAFRNMGTVLKIFGLNIVVGVLSLVIIALMFVAFMGLSTDRAFYGVFYDSLPGFLQNAATTDGVATPVATLIVGTVLLVAINIQLVAMQTLWILALLRRTPITIKGLFRDSLRAIPAILGLGFLILLIATGIGLVLGGVAAAIDDWVFLAVIPLMVYGIYISLRLGFTTYSLVDKKLGPIAALKDSWRLTKGNLWELVGATAVTAIIAVMPGIDILSELARLAVEDSIFGIIAVEVVYMLLSLLVAVIATLVISKRYLQFRQRQQGTATRPKVHILNYFAVIIAIAIVSITSGVSYAIANADGDTYETDSNSLFDTESDFENEEDVQFDADFNLN